MNTPTNEQVRTWLGWKLKKESPKVDGKLSGFAEHAKAGSPVPDAITVYEKKRPNNDG